MWWRGDVCSACVVAGGLWIGLLCSPAVWTGSHPPECQEVPSRGVCSRSTLPAGLCWGAGHTPQWAWLWEPAPRGGASDVCITLQGAANSSAGLPWAHESQSPPLESLLLAVPAMKCLLSMNNQPLLEKGPDTLQVWGALNYSFQGGCHVTSHQPEVI